MKKFYLLTKTLLVATMLLAGASNAWATTYEKTHIFPTDECGSNSAWTRTSGNNISVKSETQWNGVSGTTLQFNSDGNYYLNLATKFPSTIKSFTISFYYRPKATNTGQLYVYPNKNAETFNSTTNNIASGYLFKIATTTKGASDSDDYTVTFNDDGEKTAVLNGNIYNFITLTVSGTTASYEVYQIEDNEVKATPVATGSKTISTDEVLIGGIYTSKVDARIDDIDLNFTADYIKALSYDLSDYEESATHANANERLVTKAGTLTGFGSTNDTNRKTFQKTSDWKDAQTAKYLFNGLYFAADYHCIHPDCGLALTNGSNMTFKPSVNGTMLDIQYKHNTGDAAADDGKSLFASTETSHDWKQGNVVTLKKRDAESGGYIYTAVDVYVPSNSTITPTIDETYKYATFSCPFLLDFDGVSDEMKAYIATDAGASTITLTRVVGIVPAFTPLILKGTAQAIKIAEIGTDTEDVSSNLLKSVLDGDTRTISAATDGTTNCVLSVQEEEVVFAPISSTPASVPYGKAYFNGTIPNEARGLRMVFADEITGISEAQANEAVEKEGKFIENGKLFIFKNGKRYNANGQLVK